jgi:hypothetical protein
MMTEKEAKTKLCPQHGIVHCAASDCMAWRQVHKKGDLIADTVLRGLDRETITLKVAEHSAGYCGLAGKP